MSPAATKSNPFEEKNPLKQGLKLCCRLRALGMYSFEEKNPLKQGLKPQCRKAIWEAVNPIEEKNPLKQGLKL